jgi:hypothetical protein
MKKKCLQCGEDIPDTRMNKAIYCGFTCQHAARISRQYHETMTVKTPEQQARRDKWNERSRIKRMKRKAEGRCTRCGKVNDCLPLTQCTECSARLR